MRLTEDRDETCINARHFMAIAPIITIYKAGEIYRPHNFYPSHSKPDRGMRSALTQLKSMGLIVRETCSDGVFERVTDELIDEMVKFLLLRKE